MTCFFTAHPTESKHLPLRHASAVKFIYFGNGGTRRTLQQEVSAPDICARSDLSIGLEGVSRCIISWSPSKTLNNTIRHAPLKETNKTSEGEIWGQETEAAGRLTTT